MEEETQETLAEAVLPFLLLHHFRFDPVRVLQSGTGWHILLRTIFFMSRRTALAAISVMRKKVPRFSVLIFFVRWLFWFADKRHCLSDAGQLRRLPPPLTRAHCFAGDASGECHSKVAAFPLLLGINPSPPLRRPADLGMIA